jgi:hypothetical protein
VKRLRRRCRNRAAQDNHSIDHDPPARGSHQPARISRVRAAFLAAAERAAEPFAREALRADADRSALERRLAALRACFASATDDIVMFEGLGIEVISS